MLIKYFCNIEKLLTVNCWDLLDKNDATACALNLNHWSKVLDLDCIISFRIF